MDGERLEVGSQVGMSVHDHERDGEEGEGAVEAVVT